MYIHELNTGTPGDEDYIAIDNGIDTYKTSFVTAVQRVAQGVVSSVSAALNSLSEYVGTGTFPGASTLSAAVAWLYDSYELLVQNMSTQDGNISALQSRMTAAESDIGNRLLVWTGQLTVSVSCPAGATTAVFSAYDVSGYLPDGATLKAATVGWTTGNLIPVNVQVISGKLYVYLYNYKDSAVTVSAVAVQLFYTV